MKVTVCQLPDDRDDFWAAWQELAAHVRRAASELVVLPEMPFCSWFGHTPVIEPARWQSAIEAHDQGERRLAELGSAIVAATRPVEFGNERWHEGFVWDRHHGLLAVHASTSVPDEKGMWAAAWYNHATPAFIPLELDEVDIGFLIGAELEETEQARLYGIEGVHILVTPRTTRARSVEPWLHAARIAAEAAAAYSLSSNRSGNPNLFGGQGWIIAPDGQLLGLTSDDEPFLSLDVDLAAADAAKRKFEHDPLVQRSRPRVKFETEPPFELGPP